MIRCAVPKTYRIFTERFQSMSTWVALNTFSGDKIINHVRRYMIMKFHDLIILLLLLLNCCLNKNAVIWSQFWEKIGIAFELLFHSRNINLLNCDRQRCSKSENNSKLWIFPYCYLEEGDAMANVKTAMRDPVFLSMACIYWFHFHQIKEYTSSISTGSIRVDCDTMNCKK